MLHKRWIWIALIALVLAGGGGYAAYAKGLIPWLEPQGAEIEGTALETATVTTGDLSITASGSGQLVPSAEVELAFDGNGTLIELLVEVGDQVQAGDVLGWLDDTDARNAVVSAELKLMQAQEALEDAGDTAALEQGVAQTKASLVEAREALDDLENWAPDGDEIAVAQANLTISKEAYIDYRLYAQAERDWE